MELEPEKESAKKHGLENTHNSDNKTNENKSSTQASASMPDVKNDGVNVSRDSSKKHGKENTK